MVYVGTGFTVSSRAMGTSGGGTKTLNLLTPGLFTKLTVFRFLTSLPEIGKLSYSAFQYGVPTHDPLVSVRRRSEGIVHTR